MKVLGYLVAAIGIFGFILGLSLLFAWPMMFAINYTFAPSLLVLIFGGPLTFWKAWTFSFIVGALFNRGTSSSK